MWLSVGRYEGEMPAFRLILVVLFGSACDEPFLHHAPQRAFSTCGDGIVQAGEECDDGLGNDDELPNACRTTCRAAHCGDGVVDTGEECDEETDVCNPDCTAWAWEVTGPKSGFVGQAVAIDANGNILVAGTTPPTDGLLEHAWVQKYDPSGVLLWTWSSDAPLPDFAYAVAVDADGDVYVVGTTETDLVIEGVRTPDGWLRKISSQQGTLLWERVRNSGVGYDIDYLFGLAVEGDSIWVAGAESTEGQAFTLWLGRYDPDGNLLVSMTPDPDAIYSSAYDLALDSQSNLVVAGVRRLRFHADYSVAKYAPDGTPLWRRQYDGGVTGTIDANALAIDEHDNIIVVGRWSSGWNPPFDTDMFVRKYSTTGEPLWFRSFGGATNNNDIALDVAVDRAGRIIVVGEEAVGVRELHALIRIYDASGVLMAHREHDSPALGHDSYSAIALTDSRGFVVTGTAANDDGSCDTRVRRYMQ